MNTNILAVDISTYSVYDFLKDGETEFELLERANNYKKNDIESWEKNYKDYPSEQFKTYLDKAKKKNYRVMTWEEFQQGQREYLLSDNLVEVTEEQWNEALNVLPPSKWCEISGVEMFCMSERYTGTYTTQYAKCNGKYYSKMVDCLDKSTWIHNLLREGE